MYFERARIAQIGLFLFLFLSVPMHLWVGFPEYARGDYLRPVYSYICPVVGCVLPEYRDISLIDVENLQVRYVEEPEPILVLEFSLINRANYLNAYPQCRIVFQDIEGIKLSQFEFDSISFLVDSTSKYRGMPVGIPMKIVVPLEEPSMKAVNYELVLM